jgi:hypothetical protein
VDSTSVGSKALNLENLKPDLRPVFEQMTIPHHPYLDLIPFSSFRKRALTAIASDRLQFSEDELCFDLMNGGIKCQAVYSRISLHGRGEGTAWDSHSWEAAPWFLQKWAFLLEGPGDPMYRSNLWWGRHK